MNKCVSKVENRLSKWFQFLGRVVAFECGDEFLDIEHPAAVGIKATEQCFEFPPGEGNVEVVDGTEQFFQRQFANLRSG